VEFQTLPMLIKKGFRIEAFFYTYSMLYALFFML
jgi:hypothetical protein